MTDVQVMDNLMLLLTFNDGTRRLFDAVQLKGPVFKCLNKPEIFKTANIEYGVVTWMNGEIDCAPEFMYEHSCQFDGS